MEKEKYRNDLAESSFLLRVIFLFEENKAFIVHLRRYLFYI